MDVIWLTFNGECAIMLREKDANADSKQKEMKTAPVMYVVS